MHTLIRVVVDAHDEQSAVSAAESYFDSHLYEGNGGQFEYCSSMREKEFGSGGADNWTEYEDEPAAYPATSEKGREEIQAAWDATVRGVKQDAKVVFDVAEQCDTAEEFAQAVLDSEDGVDYRMSNAGTGASTDNRLYVEDWYSSGVTATNGWSRLQDRLAEAPSADEDEDADELVTDAEEMSDDDRQLWVVPLDTHY